MPISYRVLLAFLLLMVVPSPAAQASILSGEASTARLDAAAPTLRIAVQPGQIAVGRDVPLRIVVTNAGGQPVAAQVSISGAGNPVIGGAHGGVLRLTVHAQSVGTATMEAVAPGYVLLTQQIPIVPGSPASVLAVTRGLTIVAPHRKPQAAAVGDGLFQDYHAVTASAQRASLGLRDGSLADLNSGTDVVIADPLNATLNQGELFLEVAHGASHQVQVGTAVAATAGARLDIRYLRGQRTGIVTVIEGRVLVSNQGRSVLVGAGEQTTVLPSRPPSLPAQVDLRTLVSWVQALPNSTSTTVPPVFSIPPAPPMPVQTPPSGRVPHILLTGTLIGSSISGVVLVTGTATLPAGTTLRLAPGTVVEFGPDALLEVDGVLRAEGTAAAPITFTSFSPHPQPGDWQALRIENSSASGSVLDHVRMFYGGFDHAYSVPGMVLVRAGANIAIRDSLFAFDSNGAISVDDSSRPTIADCLFADDAGSPINAAVDLFGQVAGVRLAPGQAPIVARQGAITHTAIWPVLQPPLVLTGTVTLNAGTTLTLKPGTIIAMGPNSLLQVDGTLSAAGTARAPITFTSAAVMPQPGDWQALRIENATASKSLLDHVQIFYGGIDQSYNTPGALLLRAGASITVRNSLVAQDSSGAVFVDDATRPTITNCLFAGDAGSPVDASVDTLGLFTHLHFAAGQAPIVARPGTIATSTTWLPSEVPVVLTGTVTLAAHVILSLAPGTVIALGPGALFQVDGTLKADGSAGAPVMFTSAAAQPKPGDWQVLRVENASAAASSLRNVQVLYGGFDRSYNVPGMLLIRAGANISVKDSGFAQGPNGGIYVDTASQPTIIDNAFSAIAGTAILLPAADLLLVHGNTFGPDQQQVVEHS